MAMARFRQAMNRNTSTPYHAGSNQTPSAISINMRDGFASSPTATRDRERSLYSRMKSATPRQTPWGTPRETPRGTPRGTPRRPNSVRQKVRFSSNALSNLNLHSLSKLNSNLYSMSKLPSVPVLTLLTGPDELYYSTTAPQLQSHGTDFDVKRQSFFYVHNKEDVIGGFLAGRYFYDFFHFDEITDALGDGTFGAVFKCYRVDQVDDSQSVIGSDDDEEEEESEDETSEAESR